MENREEKLIVSLFNILAPINSKKSVLLFVMNVFKLYSTWIYICNLLIEGGLNQN